MLDVLEGREVNAVRILSVATELIARNWVICAVASVALGISQALLSIAAQRWFGIGLGIKSGQMGVFVRPLLALPMTSIIQYLVMRRLQFTEGLADQGWAPLQLWRFVLATLLTMIVFGLGLILLIVPGIILMMRLVIVGNFVIGRGMGPEEAVKASWEATLGSAWAIFWSIFAVMSIGVMGGAICGGISIHAGQVGSITELVIIKSFSGLMEMVTICVSIAIYVLLVGPLHGRLSEVFA